MSATAGATAAPNGAAAAVAPSAGPVLARRQVHAVAGCYFVASFAALGLPPFLSEILPGLGDPAARWAGVLYIVPTVFGAVGAPFWGRLADRYGRKRLLLRAQLGLAVSFLLAGWADSIAAFTAALVLQGVLGGTFAASNGYLGAALEGPALSKALTLMQGAARAALVVAPIVVGSLSPWVSPHRQYALLAVLPLAAALLICALPESRGGRAGVPATEDAPAPAPEVTATHTPDPAPEVTATHTSFPAFEVTATQQACGTWDMTATQATAENVTAAQEPAATAAAAPGQEATTAEAAATATPPTAPAPRTSLRALYALELAFVFSTVISFPYLVPLIEERLPGTSPAVSGVLFALPHLCYLVTAMAVHKAFHHRPRPGLALGFLCVALGLAGHGVADSLPALTAVRLVLGAGLTLGLVCLSALAADCARGRAPGGMFGSLEFFSKAGAVAAGVAAAVGNGFFGPAAPVLTGTAVALAVTAPAALPHVNPLRTRRSRTRWSR